MKKEIKSICVNSSYSKIEEFDEDILLKFTARKIAFKILYELKRRKWNQQNLAERLNVSPQNVSKLLKGEDYKISTLIRIEEALSINLIDRDIYRRRNINFLTVEIMHTSRNFGRPEDINLTFLFTHGAETAVTELLQSESKFNNQVDFMYEI